MDLLNTDLISFLELRFLAVLRQTSHDFERSFGSDDSDVRSSTIVLVVRSFTNIYELQLAVVP